MTDVSSPPMQTQAHLEFLQRFSPFNGMETDALAFLAQRVMPVSYPQDNLILEAARENPRHFFIIQNGTVLARQTYSYAMTEPNNLSLGPGECFPISAIVTPHPPNNNYIAQTPCTCFQITAEAFMQLMQMSTVFHLFCTRHIASLLNQSYQQRQASFFQRASELQSMASPLKTLIKQTPVCIQPETTIRAALEKMAEKRIGSIAIVNEATQPIGIFTQTDLLPRVVLPQIDLTCPIRDIMTPSPYTLQETATAYDAVLEMATHNIRHLLIIDSNNKLQGVISERDLFSLQRISLRQLHASIENASNKETLQQASHDIRELALNLIAQGVGSEQLTRFISTLNDALTRRILTLINRQHHLDDIDYAWIAFGSEGRHEQTLSTDQDNGIVWQPSPEISQPAELIQQRLLTFAQEVNHCLAECGFPLCKGNIMASNPELCLPLKEWQNRFSDWIREPHPEALLNASIFFDFRIIYGNAKLGESLYQWLSMLAQATPAFQRMMAANALSVPSPLGRIRDFIVDSAGLINLKTSGSRLFVDAARILALRSGIEASNTATRLQLVAQKIGAPQVETTAIIDAFHFIQLLRLRTQYLETKDATSSDNKINPDQLNELDRRILKEAFRQARKLQQRLKLDYQL